MTLFLVPLYSPQDLKKGTKIISADGTPTVVTKVDGQKANILLELERPGSLAQFAGGKLQGSYGP